MKKNAIRFTIMSGSLLVLAVFFIYGLYGMRSIIKDRSVDNGLVSPIASHQQSMTYNNNNPTSTPEQKYSVIEDQTPLPEPSMEPAKISGYGVYTQINDDWRAINRKDSYNKELQFYSDTNVILDDGMITLYARKEEREGKSYTSGMLESNYSYLYGSFEFTVIFPEGKGLFPAIWLMPEEDKALPEIDLFEVLGSEPLDFYGVIHYQNGTQRERDYFCHSVEPKDKYKVGLTWTKSEISWFIDDECVYTTTKGIPNEAMYIIVNLAVGGVWPGEPDETTTFPASFNVESYRMMPEWEEER